MLISPTIVQTSQLVLQVLFPIGLLAYLAMKRREYPKPIGMAMLAIALILIFRVASTLGIVWAARRYPVSQISDISYAVSVVSEIINVIALLLLIGAVFMDRAPVTPIYHPNNRGDGPPADPTNQNPYASPSPIDTTKADDAARRRSRTRGG